MSLAQYLKDTQAELRHVAWPTRTQTVVFTVLVAAISIFVAAYLGFFDYVFTKGLTNYLGTLPAESGIEITPLDNSTSVLDVDISTTTNTQ